MADRGYRDPLDPYSGGWNDVDDETAERYGGTHGLNSHTLDGSIGTPATGLSIPGVPGPGFDPWAGEDKTQDWQGSMQGLRDGSIPGLGPPASHNGQIPGYDAPSMLGGPKSSYGYGVEGYPSLGTPNPGWGGSVPGTTLAPQGYQAPAAPDWAASAFGFDIPSNYAGFSQNPFNDYNVGLANYEMNQLDIRDGLPNYGGSPAVASRTGQFATALPAPTAPVTGWADAAFGFATPGVSLAGLPGISPDVPSANPSRTAGTGGWGAPPSPAAGTSSRASTSLGLGSRSAGPSTGGRSGGAASGRSRVAAAMAAPANNPFGDGYGNPFGGSTGGYGGPSGLGGPGYSGSAAAGGIGSVSGAGGLGQPGGGDWASDGFGW